MSLLVNSNLSRDYDSLVEKVEEVIKSLTDDWNDFSEGDVATILVKLFISITDMQFYQFDKGLLEQFVDTVKERHNLISILKNVGYYPKSFKPVVAQCTVTNSSETNTFTLTKYASFSPVDDDLERFEFVYLGDPVAINPGESAVVTMYQITRQVWPSMDPQQPLVDQTDTRGVRLNTLNVGNANNVKIAISGINDKVAIDGISSIEIYSGGQYVDAGYREVSNFVDDLVVNSSDSEDKMFRLYVDRDNRTYLEIYNTSFIASQRVRFNYYITEGADVPQNIVGNVASFNGTNTDVTMVIDSIEAGKNPETIEEARESASKYTRSLNKAVTSDDYKNLLGDFLLDNINLYRNYDRVVINPIDYYINEVLTKMDDESSPHKIQNLDARAMYVYLPILGSKAINDDEQGVQKISLLSSVAPSVDEPSQIDIISSYLQTIKMIGVVDNVLEVHNAVIEDPEPLHMKDRIGKIYVKNSGYYYQGDPEDQEIPVEQGVQTEIGTYYLASSTGGIPIGYYVNPLGNPVEFYSCRAFYKYGLNDNLADDKLPVCITRFKVYLNVQFRGYTETAKAESRRLITKRLAEYYGLSEKSFGRTLSISELFSVIMNVDMNAIINISTGLKYDVYYDLVGDNSDTTIKRLSQSQEQYDGWINEVLLFGGIEFTN